MEPESAVNSVAPALDPPATADSFCRDVAGTISGQDVCQIKLTNQGGKRGGAIIYSTIQWDKNGELTSAEQKDGEDPISDGRILVVALQ